MQNPSRLAELRETKVKERELAMKQKQAAVAAATAAAAAASTMPPYDPRQAAIHAQQQQQQYMGGGARMPGGVPPYPGRPMLPSAANVVTIPSMQPQTAVGQRFPTPQQQIGAPPQGHISKILTLQFVCMEIFFISSGSSSIGSLSTGSNVVRPYAASTAILSDPTDATILSASANATANGIFELIYNPRNYRSNWPVLFLA